jgi:hypothetical protein
MQNRSSCEMRHIILLTESTAQNRAPVLSEGQQPEWKRSSNTIKWCKAYMALFGRGMYTVEIDIRMARAMVVVCCRYACVPALMCVKHMVRRLEKEMLAFSCTTLLCLAIRQPCKWWFVHLNNRCGHVSTSWIGIAAYVRQDVFTHVGHELLFMYWAYQI